MADNQYIPIRFSKLYSNLVDAMSAEEFGAYTLLLCKAWNERPAGTLPSDDLILARWARIEPDRWSACKARILAPFTFSESLQRYCDKELRQDFDAMQARSAHARKAAKAKKSKHLQHAQNPSTAPAEPEHSPSTASRAFVCSSSLVNSSSPEKERIELVVQKLRARHPAIRTCGPAEIRKQLTAILKHLPKIRQKYPDVGTVVDLLDLIDRNHELRCQTLKWCESNGQYANGLANWLAPTEYRYMDPPTEAELQAVPGRGKPLKSNMDNVMRIFEAQKEMGWL